MSIIEGLLLLEKLGPRDTVKVYHATMWRHAEEMLNGFDATSPHYRYYNSPRHPGLFVTDNFKTAQGFGAIVLELEVRAKNLHATSYGGDIFKKGSEEPYWKGFKGDRWDALDMTMTQMNEPQALLVGTVPPNKIKRVFVTEPGKYTGKWFTRKQFLAQSDQLNPGSKARDVGLNLSSTRTTPEQFLKWFAKHHRYKLSHVIDTFKDLDHDTLAFTLETSAGLKPIAVRALLPKLKKHLGIKT